MSDGARSPQRPPAPGRTSTNPSLPRVMSAAREQPLAPEPERPLKERLASGASSSALNGVAMLREALEDFRNRDRYFKYKALIVSVWVLLSATSVGIACPSQGLRRSGDLGARLVLTHDGRWPVFTVFNDSQEAWEDVTVVINGRYRAASGFVKPGGNITLTPRQLLGADGEPAPGDLKVRDLEVRSRDGDDVLMRGGVQQ